MIIAHPKGILFAEVLEIKKTFQGLVPWLAVGEEYHRLPIHYIRRTAGLFEHGSLPITVVVTTSGDESNGIAHRGQLKDLNQTDMADLIEVDVANGKHRSANCANRHVAVREDGVILFRLQKVHCFAVTAGECNRVTFSQQIKSQFQIFDLVVNDKYRNTVGRRILGQIEIRSPHHVHFRITSAGLVGLKELGHSFDQTSLFNAMGHHGPIAVAAQQTVRSLKYVHPMCARRLKNIERWW